MIAAIKGTIQKYAWGGKEYIPHLLNLENVSEPYAEYWLGAHPKAPSEVYLPEQETALLNDLIEKDPAGYLGQKAAGQFGRLPYLFKILDVHDMLSIQVHPSKKEAEKGFAKENEKGIPLTAKDRNYKDENHKPEMMVALSPFYLLHGFLEESLMKDRLQSTPELKRFAPVFEEKGYEGLYAEVMKMSQEEVNRILDPLIDRAVSLYQEDKLEKLSPEFWAARAVLSGLSDRKNPDRGIFSIFFFNIVYLEEGQGIFQGAGIPHAYLEGQNVELMANSDNVLRGGLTKKHVDVEELMKHMAFKGVSPEIFNPQEEDLVCRYSEKVADFYLERISFDKKREEVTFQTRSLEILLCLEGEIALFDKKRKSYFLKKGDAICITAGEDILLRAGSPSLLFKAGVPD